MPIQEELLKLKLRIVTHTYIYEQIYIQDVYQTKEMYKTVQSEMRWTKKYGSMSD